MTEIIRVVDHRPWDAVRFPTGGKAQAAFRNWFKDTFPGVEFHLYDGAVQHSKEPHEDGAYWQWIYAGVGTWNRRDGVKNFQLIAGDYLLSRTNDRGAWEFRPATPHQLTTSYQEAA